MDLSESQKKAANCVESEKNKAEQEGSEPNRYPKKAANCVESEKNKAEQEGSEPNRAASMPMLPVGGQLTFFYNGSVSVFDGVTPEKAQAIMLIAAAAAAVSGSKTGPAAVAAAVGPTAVAAALTRSLSQQSSSVAAAGTQPVAAAPTPPAQQKILGVVANGNSLCKLHADLPIARRHSLQQFLEKRRNRLVSKAPYAPAKGMEPGMDVKPQPQPQPRDLSITF